MLYISKYDKYNLDKSSQSMYAYYTRLINDINTDVIEIRDYLVNMLDVVANLRTRLYDIKDSIQEDLDTTKEAYEEAGYTNGALDQVQEILDGAEEDLGNLEDKVTNTIEAIDCNEVPEGCNYVEDCSEGCDEAEEPKGPVCTYDTSIPDPDGCAYCQYSSTTSTGVGNEDCSVCNHDGCQVNYDCDEHKPASDCIFDIPQCYYEITYDPECGQQVETNKECEERTCTYGGNEPGTGTCNFTCTWGGSACGETSVSGCTFSCTDGSLCNYDASCEQCSFTSTYVDPYCGESSDCTEGCVFDTPGCEFSCSHDSNGSCSYDSEIGFDYGCNEWADDCREPTDCSQGSSDDDSNVVCTYIIKRLFNCDITFLEMSRENVKIGLRNGLNKKAFREYYNGLGLEIIEHLKQETDGYLQTLWLNNIQPVWDLLRAKPKEGVIRYAKFIIDQAEHYNIDWHKYKNIEAFRDNL